MVPAGIEPRLLRTDLTSSETLGEYLDADGYRDPPAPDDMLALIEAAGLRGRGGAAFPMAAKIRAVRSRPGPHVLVGNGAEGEPLSVKDRWLMRMRPHLVLDGLRLLAATLDIDRAIVAVEDRWSAAALNTALAEGPPGPVIEVAQAPLRYVGGEETALVRHLCGGPALPTPKPPRPFESGVDERPTLVSNVESIANLPFLARHGADRFRGAGTPDSPGTFLLTLSGAGGPATLCELPFGIGLDEVVRTVWGTPASASGYVMGGYFGGVLGPPASDLRLSYEGVQAVGSGLGCGAIAVLGDDDCPIRAAADIMSFFDRENARQCGACFRGTAAMSGALRSLSRGELTDQDAERLAGWSVSLRGRGDCATIDGAAQLAASLLSGFPELVRAHREAACPRCARETTSWTVTDPVLSSDT